LEIVESVILNACNLNTNRVGARSLSVKRLTKEESKTFLTKNHLMGAGRGDSFGLVDSAGTIYSIMQIICKSKSDNFFEVSRFCNALQTTVAGGYSKLLKYVESVIDMSSLITFVDLSYGTGVYLTNLGFIKSTFSRSFKWTDGRDVYNRMQYPGKTGFDYGLDRLWDSGQQKWVKNYS
jgi:hypothetical protein